MTPSSFAPDTCSISQSAEGARKCFKLGRWKTISLVLEILTIIVAESVHVGRVNWTWMTLRYGLNTMRQWRSVFDRSVTTGSRKCQFTTAEKRNRLQLSCNKSRPKTSMSVPIRHCAIDTACELFTSEFFMTRSHLSPNLAVNIFSGFAVSVHTSIPKLLPPSHWQI